MEGSAGYPDGPFALYGYFGPAPIPNPANVTGWTLIGSPIGMSVIQSVSIKGNVFVVAGAATGDIYPGSGTPGVAWATNPLVLADWTAVSLPTDTSLYGAIIYLVGPQSPRLGDAPI
jgi:hypothetical protein